MLSVVAVLAVAGQMWLASTFGTELYRSWKRVFVDGRSDDAFFMTLAALVLLLLLPVSQLRSRAGRLAALCLAVSALLNVVLAVGYVIVAATWDGSPLWRPPSVMSILVHDISVHGLGVVVLFVLVNARIWRRDPAPDTTSADVLAGYLDEPPRS